MSEVKTICVKQIGGDKDWWTYGGIFLRVFEQDSHIYREVWNCIGLEDEFCDCKDDSRFCEDDPNLEVTTYRASLPDKDDRFAFAKSEGWVDWNRVQSFTGVDPVDYEHDYELLVDAASYYGWMNFDSDPVKYKQSELEKILELEKAELY